MILYDDLAFLNAKGPQGTNRSYNCGRLPAQFVFYSLKWVVYHAISDSIIAKSFSSSWKDLEDWSRTILWSFFFCNLGSFFYIMLTQHMHLKTKFCLWKVTVRREITVNCLHGSLITFIKYIPVYCSFIHRNLVAPVQIDVAYHNLGATQLKIENLSYLLIHTFRAQCF